MSKLLYIWRILPLACEWQVTSHVQAVEKGVLTYRLPLLNETLPALPNRLANSSLGQIAQHIVDKASVSLSPYLQF